MVNVCNNYSWDNYSGTEGYQYFSPELQYKLFYKDLNYNINFIKENRVISNCYIDKINDMVIKGNKAQVSLSVKHIITDKSGTVADCSGNMVISLYKEQNKWIIENVIFSKGGIKNE
ncbi:MAG: hypothetical protein K6T65_15440 [Peptococcaceae bacterium]|nr:hypothetical protein [Peptococcaceae bacterium]